MSSRISKYPGREIGPDDLRAGKYIDIGYETRLEYEWTSGEAIGRFLEGLKHAKLWGRRCDECGRIVIPPRMYCELCFRPTDEWVRLKDTGRVVTYSVCYVNADASRRGPDEDPIIVAVIEIDGASPMMGILHKLGEVPPDDIRIGARVKAVWRPPAERVGAITDIRYFRPLDRPDGAEKKETGISAPRKKKGQKKIRESGE